MAWFITAIVVGVLSNQVFCDELPKLPGGLNLQNILILLCLLGLFGALGRPKDPVRPDFPKTSTYLKIYLVLSFFAVFYAPIFTPYSYFPTGIDDNRVQEWRDEFTGMLMFFYAANCIRSEKEIRRVLVVLVFVCAYYSFYYLVRYYPEVDRIQAIPMPEGFSALEWEEEQKWMIKKVSGVFTNVGSNEMAAFYVYVAIFFTGLFWHYRSAFWRVLVPIEIAVLVLATVYSASRGALLATAAAVGYCFTRRKKWVNRAVVVASFFIPAFASDQSAALRFDLWKAAILFGIKYPLGIGYHVFPYKHQEVHGLKLDTHNYFMRAWAEVGPIGFFCIVSSFIAGIKLGWLLHDTARTDFSKGVGRGCAMMWAALVVSNMFGDRLSYAHTGVVVWSLTGFAMALLLKEERERQAEGSIVTEPAPDLPLALGGDGDDERLTTIPNRYQ